MEHYNEAVWGPIWIWVFGSFVFVSGLALTVWFYQMARQSDAKDAKDAPPRVIRRGGPGAPEPPT